MRIKENEKSKLFIQKVVNEKFNRETGRKIKYVRWELANGEVNLGSVAKPNNKITGFKYEVEQERGNPFDIFFKK